MRRLARRVLELGAQPARQRLAIVVIDRALEVRDAALQADAMPMALVLIARAVDAVEHGARRVERAAQGMAVDAIDEGRLVARVLGRGLKARKFRTRRRSLSS